MFTTFELKSYPQLNFALGAVNALLLLGGLLLGFHLVLAPADQLSAQNAVRYLTAGKVNDVVPLSFIAILWVWIATIFFRLHDRIHEPHLRKWRSGYDADFILRALCRDIVGISEEFFSRACADHRMRNRMMQRLFYNFIGDDTTTASGRRIFFYTEMWKFWSFALLDLYSTVFIIGASVYLILQKSMLSPSLMLAIIVLIVFSRVMQNKILDAAHEVTEEQIAAVKRNHADALRTEVISIATDIGA